MADVSHPETVETAPEMHKQPTAEAPRQGGDTRTAALLGPREEQEMQASAQDEEEIQSENIEERELKDDMIAIPEAHMSQLDVSSTTVMTVEDMRRMREELEAYLAQHQTMEVLLVISIRSEYNRDKKSIAV